MNLYTPQNGKKHKIIQKKTIGRTKEEFAKGFIESYDGALKRIMRKERGQDAKEFIRELKKEVAEDTDNERERN